MYPNTDVFIVCCSLGDKSTLDNVKAKWVPEVRRHSPNSHLLLVGLKADLKNFCSEDLVTPEQGEQMADEVGAAGYCECSSLQQTGVREVMEDAVRVALGQPPKGFVAANGNSVKHAR